MPASFPTLKDRLHLAVFPLPHHGQFDLFAKPEIIQTRDEFIVFLLRSRKFGTGIAIPSNH